MKKAAAQERPSATRVASHPAHDPERRDAWREAISQAKRKYPPAEPRQCAYCSDWFRPENNRPERKFCSTECGNAAKAERANPDLTLRERRERALMFYEQGLSYVEVGERIGVTAMTARRDVMRTGGDSRPAHRRPIHVADGQNVECGCGCGRTRWIRASQGYRFLGNDCWARYRWDHRYDPKMNLEPLIRKAWPGQARQRNPGKLYANKPPAPGGKPRGRPSVELTDEERRRIKLASRRWGRRKIANEFGLSERTVRNVLDA
jgi:hypothetical protein